MKIKESDNGTYLVKISTDCGCVRSRSSQNEPKFPLFQTKLNSNKRGKKTGLGCKNSIMAQNTETNSKRKMEVHAMLAHDELHCAKMLDDTLC